MNTGGRTVLAAINAFAEEPTPASTWHAFAGSPFTEEPPHAELGGVCQDRVVPVGHCQSVGSDPVLHRAHPGAIGAGSTPDRARDCGYRRRRAEHGGHPGPTVASPLWHQPRRPPHRGWHSPPLDGDRHVAGPTQPGPPPPRRR